MHLTNRFVEPGLLRLLCVTENGHHSRTEATHYEQQLATGDIVFVNYRDKGDPFRNRVMFDRSAFSFVQNCEKLILRAAENVS